MNLNIIKKIAIVLSISVWIALIYKIFQAGGTMNDQLPKCIFTTMGIFALLNIIVKIIEHLEKKK